MRYRVRMASPPTTIRLQPDVRAGVERYAKRNGISLSVAVNTLLVRALMALPPETTDLTKGDTRR